MKNATRLQIVLLRALIREELIREWPWSKKKEETPTPDKKQRKTLCIDWETVKRNRLELHRPTTIRVAKVTNNGDQDSDPKRIEIDWDTFFPEWMENWREVDDGRLQKYFKFIRDIANKSGAQFVRDQLTDSEVIDIDAWQTRVQKYRDEFKNEKQRQKDVKKRDEDDRDYRDRSARDRDNIAALERRNADSGRVHQWDKFS